MDINCLRSELQSFINSFDVNRNNINNEYNHQNCDQLWVNQWISRRFERNANNSQIISKRKSVTNNININEFSLQLKSVINLMSIFNEKYNYLNTNIDNFNDEKWDSILSEINDEKKIIEQKVLLIQQKVPLIECKLNKVKRKRIAKFRFNLTHKKLCEESLERKNKLIDEWFEGKNELKDRIKREMNTKKEADIVLIEVRKKISDARKYLKKVNALEKTRNALKSSAQQRSQFTSTESDSLFLNQISQITTLMKERLQIYQKEENALKSMIQNEYEKRFNDNLSNQTECVFNELNEKQLNIYESLFGSTQFPEPNNLRSLINWQYYEQSHHNIHNMTRIRHLWDNYLNSSEGSSIPKTYVWPPNVPNPLWHNYIKK